MWSLRKTRCSLEILTLLLLGCGEVEEGACVTRSDATFQLGTGQDAFVPLSDGSELRMTRGTQGGCHLTLAFLTDGFAGEETLVRYRLDNLIDGREIIVSQQFVRLEPAGMGRCRATNFAAFLVEPWEAEDDRIRVEVKLEEEADGRSDTQSVEVVARWPEPVEGIERDRWCGER
jgi:hypothetical protein